MVREEDRSGWMIFDVLDQRLTYSIVVTVAGVYTTVDITKTFLSPASTDTLVTCDSFTLYHLCSLTQKFHPTLEFLCICPAARNF